MSIQVPAPHIRSFHARRGRMSPKAVARMEQLWPAYGVAVDGRPIDLRERFGGLPVVLEIGFGLGDATATMAEHDPATGVLAVDVHTPGVLRLLLLVEQLGLANVRVAHGDAVELVRDQLSEQSLAGVRVFFPDPWPKNRHQKRRLIQPKFAALVASRLRPGGFVHVATDWPDYADHMRTVLDQEPLLHNAFAGPAPRPPDRPITKFERTGLDLGHPVTDLVYRRNRSA